MRARITKLSSRCAFVALFACFVANLPVSAQNVEHPLDPLTAQEYLTVLDVLRNSGHLDSETRFSIVTLREPLKAVVWDWSPGKDFPREAFAVVRQGAVTQEAVVDLKQRKLTSWTELKNAQPNPLMEELEAMVNEVKGDPTFLAALKKRGITDLTFIQCVNTMPGSDGAEELKGRRIGNVVCFDTEGARNTWHREIQGLVAVVDLNAKKILRIVDEGVTPMTKANADYDAAAIGPTREVRGPMRIDQPAGPGFRIEGHIVEWQKWRFHLRADQRVGTIISTVTYADGKRRQVMYEGHLSEMFVPYMDPSFAWVRRTFFDAGENAGTFLKALLPGADCPDSAVYIDAFYAGDDGRPNNAPNSICIFEREAGEMAWRHDNYPGVESRPKRDLVVRGVAALGNYDYVFDWAFQQDGSIRVSVGATGIAASKSVRQTRADTRVDANIESGDTYGRFVDENLVAVNHDHYFNFRLDMDVDGPVNNFVADRLVAKTLPPPSPRSSIWVREPMLAHRESDGMLNMDMEQPALWRVLSATQKNHVGYPTSFQLMPEMTAASILAPDDYARRRAGFTDHQLWVTPYRPEERYAAGDYPTLSTPSQGLPSWTKQNRAIEQTDIVLWYTIGMHHVVRGEDWPVMPVLWHTFELRPFDFFDRNPALDLPR